MIQGPHWLLRIQEKWEQGREKRWEGRGRTEIRGLGPLSDTNSEGKQSSPSLERSQ